MKIAVISAQVFAVPVSGYSGLEHLAWQQAKYLALRGHQVILFAPNGSSCPGCQVVHTGEPGWDEKVAYGGDGKPGGWGGYWSLLPQMDCIISNDWQKNAYLLKMEGRLPAPVLGVCHAPVDTMFKELPPLEKPCFVCISEDQANHFRGLFNKDCRVAYNGIDTTVYAPLALPRSDRFLFLARFSTIKGPDIAIQACKDAGVGLDLIGDTTITGEPELLKRCLDMADGKQIRVLGGMSRGECVWWFSQAKALLHPAGKGWREPFGLSPVESMSCGTPVIAYDAGALRETIYHCENFKPLVKNYDEFVAAIKAAAGPNGITENDRQRCRVNASRFSVEKMAARYEELCCEAIKTGGW